MELLGNGISGILRLIHSIKISHFLNYNQGLRTSTQNLQDPIQASGNFVAGFVQSELSKLWWEG